MRVRLISLTQPVLGSLVASEHSDMAVGLHRNFTAEELIVYIARVSNPSNQNNLETAPKLIRFLIDNKHWSPFEMANMCVEVQTSRAIAAQILRHWNIAFQEFSQRYAEVTEYEPVELRRKASKNRQSSEEVFDPLILDNYGLLEGEGGPVKASLIVNKVIEIADHTYKALLQAEVAKECARMILPLTTRTTIYMNGDIRTWIHYMSQRTSDHAQKEHRDVANLIQQIFIKQFPDTSKALGI
jgi:thymidylate synthase (FAD)